MTDNERKGFDELLRRVTAKYNEVVDKNYNEGLLDFTPKRVTTDDVLLIALADYAMRNFPEALDE